MLQTGGLFPGFFTLKALFFSPLAAACILCWVQERKLGFFWGNKLKPINSGWLHNNCSNHRIQNRWYAATKDIINHMMLVIALCCCAHSLHHAPIHLLLGVCHKLNKAQASDDVSIFEGNLNYGDKRSLEWILFASWSLFTPLQYYIWYT